MSRARSPVAPDDMPREGLPAAEPSGRETCYRCAKPQTLCLCSRMPRVDNRTGIVIFRHRRERFHSVGTARIARLALSDCTVHEVVGAIPEREFPPGTALLYPSDGARQLATLSAQERPTQLLILDGTWHHARRMVLDNPWLQRLPAVRLSPRSPSRYRIRRQAQSHHVSTIESIVAALELIEPDTPDLHRLLDIFDTMVSEQQAFMVDPAAEPRHQQRQPRPSRAVPQRFFADLERLVVVYGETAPLRAGHAHGGRQLVSWTAVRAATGEVFERFVLPRGDPPGPRQIAHMGLGPIDLSEALPLEQVARDWRAFRRDDDLLSAWNAGRLRMLRRLDERADSALQLKSLWCNTTHRRSGSLDELVADLELELAPVPVRGRAALRMAQAVAVARHLAAVAPRMARVAEG